MKLFFLSLLCVSLFAEKHELILLKKYQSDINVSGWLMSEKLDGVRAYWDGKKLISRNGKVFSAPQFFTKEFPDTELDGELWSKRGDFSNISSIVNRKKEHNGWSKLTYQVFEVPNAKGDLQIRLSHVKQSKYIKVVKQIVVKDKVMLKEFLVGVETKGGEGVVVRDGSLAYYTGRSAKALKVKSYIDDECEVIKHIEGKGKYQNMLGSLVCKMVNDKIIKIGSGFTKLERIKPPKIGTIITFKYYGLTSLGNPRFPIYLRQRN